MLIISYNNLLQLLDNQDKHPGMIEYPVFRLPHDIGCDWKTVSTFPTTIASYIYGCKIGRTLDIVASRAGLRHSVITMLSHG